MPIEHETIRSVGPEAWPEDADERIEAARKATHEVRSKVMEAPEQGKPKGVEGAQTK